VFTDFGLFCKSLYVPLWEQDKEMMLPVLYVCILIEYITMCLDSINKVEHWYVRHN